MRPGTVVATAVREEADAAGSRVATSMIRITIHQSDDDLMLRVEGCLSGPLVGELEACWLDARPLRRGRRLLVDLRGVCHVDDRGRELMARLHDDGAQFEVSGCDMPEVVREIAAGRVFIERI